ncbi:MAG TPA: YceI family protein [Thiolinea sp.]|nr:YceI family protein [Thiolinea sp.]
MKQLLTTSILALGLGLSGLAQAETYKIDSEGMHAAVNFRIKHLGYSWLYGRFNTFNGQFEYDEANPETNSLEVTIDTNSVDSNHAERDKHLRGGDFLAAEEFPEAKFVSTSYEPGEEEGTGTLQGDFTLRGVTQPLSIDIRETGAGDDPWGGYRRGYEGSAVLTLADYGIDFDLGPEGKEVELMLSVEGVRQ